MSSANVRRGVEYSKKVLNKRCKNKESVASGEKTSPKFRNSPAVEVFEKTTPGKMGTNLSNDSSDALNNDSSNYENEQLASSVASDSKYYYKRRKSLSVTDDEDTSNGKRKEPHVADSEKAHTKSNSQFENGRAVYRPTKQHQQKFVDDIIPTNEKKNKIKNSVKMSASPVTKEQICSKSENISVNVGLSGKQLTSVKNYGGAHNLNDKRAFIKMPAEKKMHEEKVHNLDSLVKAENTDASKNEVKQKEEGAHTGRRVHNDIDESRKINKKDKQKTVKKPVGIKSAHKPGNTNNVKNKLPLVELVKNGARRWRQRSEQTDVTNSVESIPSDVLKHGGDNNNNSEASNICETYRKSKNDRTETKPSSPEVSTRNFKASTLSTGNSHLNAKDEQEDNCVSSDNRRSEITFAADSYNVGINSNRNKNKVGSDSDEDSEGSQCNGYEDQDKSLIVSTYKNNNSKQCEDMKSKMPSQDNCARRNSTFIDNSVSEVNNSDNSDGCGDFISLHADSSTTDFISTFLRNHKAPERSLFTARNDDHSPQSTTQETINSSSNYTYRNYSASNFDVKVTNYNGLSERYFDSERRRKSETVVSHIVTDAARGSIINKNRYGHQYNNDDSYGYYEGYNRNFNNYNILSGNRTLNDNVKSSRVNNNETKSKSTGTKSNYRIPKISTRPSATRGDKDRPVSGIVKDSGKQQQNDMLNKRHAGSVSAVKKTETSKIDEKPGKNEEVNKINPISERDRTNYLLVEREGTKTKRDGELPAIKETECDKINRISPKTGNTEGMKISPVYRINRNSKGNKISAKETVLNTKGCESSTKKETCINVKKTKFTPVLDINDKCRQNKLLPKEVVLNNRDNESLAANGTESERSPQSGLNPCKSVKIEDNLVLRKIDKSASCELIRNNMTQKKEVSDLSALKETEPERSPKIGLNTNNSGKTEVHPISEKSDKCISNMSRDGKCVITKEEGPLTKDEGPLFLTPRDEIGENIRKNVVLRGKISRDASSSSFDSSQKFDGVKRKLSDKISAVPEKKLKDVDSEHEVRSQRCAVSAESAASTTSKESSENSTAGKLEQSCLRTASLKMFAGKEALTNVTAIKCPLQLNNTGETPRAKSKETTLPKLIMNKTVTSRIGPLPTELAGNQELKNSQVNLSSLFAGYCMNYLNTSKCDSPCSLSHEVDELLADGDLDDATAQNLLSELKEFLLTAACPPLSLVKNVCNVFAKYKKTDAIISISTLFKSQNARNQTKYLHNLLEIQLHVLTKYFGDIESPLIEIVKHVCSVVNAMDSKQEILDQMVTTIENTRNLKYKLDVYSNLGEVEDYVWTEPLLINVFEEFSHKSQNDILKERNTLKIYVNVLLRDSHEKVLFNMWKSSPRLLKEIIPNIRLIDYDSSRRLLEKMNWFQQSDQTVDYTEQEEHEKIRGVNGETQDTESHYEEKCPGTGPTSFIESTRRTATAVHNDQQQHLQTAADEVNKTCVQYPRAEPCSSKSYNNFNNANCLPGEYINQDKKDLLHAENDSSLTQSNSSLTRSNSLSDLRIKLSNKRADNSRNIVMSEQNSQNTYTRTENNENHLLDIGSGYLSDKRTTNINMYARQSGRNVVSRTNCVQQKQLQIPEFTVTNENAENNEHYSINTRDIYTRHGENSRLMQQQYSENIEFHGRSTVKDVNTETVDWSTAQPAFVMNRAAAPTFSTSRTGRQNESINRRMQYNKGQMSSRRQQNGVQFQNQNVMPDCESNTIVAGTRQQSPSSSASLMGDLQEDVDSLKQYLNDNDFHNVLKVLDKWQNSQYIKDLSHHLFVLLGEVNGNRRLLAWHDTFCGLMATAMNSGNLSAGVKKSLASVSFTLILYMVKAEYWTRAHDIFKLLMNNDFSYYVFSCWVSRDEKYSPARRNLVFVEVCMQAGDLEEAVSLLSKHNMLATNRQEWSLRSHEDDEAIHKELIKYLYDQDSLKQQSQVGTDVPLAF